MPTLGPPELILILVIVLILFGPGKLVGLGSSLGKSIREFRKATTEPDEEEDIAETDTASEARDAEAGAAEVKRTVVEERREIRRPTVSIVEETPAVEPAERENKVP